MTARLSHTKKIIFFIAVFLSLIFIWTFTFGQDSNIEFKNPETKKLLYVALALILPLSLLLTTVALWKLIEDSFQTKFIIAAVLIVFALWASSKCFQELLFDFRSEQWQTIKISQLPGNKTNNYLLEQEKIDYLVFHKPYKWRTVQVSSYLFMFWKIEKIISEENIKLINWK